jgi:hypothetical protein
LKKEERKHTKDKRNPQSYHINPEPSKKPGLLYTIARGALAFNLARTNTPNIEIDRAF